jgi:predicted MPP superfamily phosphohydrolase
MEDIMNELSMPKQSNSIITVIGVGGAGGNALNYMWKMGIKDVNFLACNTDQRALDNLDIPKENKIVMGPGLGAGNDPEEGRRLATESIDLIKQHLEANDTKMVFIAAGMGGGTGTGASPVIAELAKEMGLLTVAIVTSPLALEGADRYKQAEFFREVVNRTNALEADAIVITGDFEDGHLYSLAPALAPLRHLKARWGTFAVHGNHDYFSGHHAWQRYLRTLGIRFLNNEHVLPGPGHLVLAGITDPAAARDNCPPPNLEQALSGVPQDKPVVLLAHQPRIAREAASRGVALQLSGHTHGGMAPGLRGLVALFNDGLVQGLYRIGDTQVYVSNATGIWSGLPLRLFTPAEITLIHLVPAN